MIGMMADCAERAGRASKRNPWRLPGQSIDGLANAWPDYPARLDNGEEKSGKSARKKARRIVAGLCINVIRSRARGASLRRKLINRRRAERLPRIQRRARKRRMIR